MLNFYNGNGWLPNGVSIEIVDYEDDKGARYERMEGQIMGEREGSTSTSDEDSDSESITSCETDEDGFEVLTNDENQINENTKSAEFETWVCHYHFKKFKIKFVMNEDNVKIVRRIMTEESSIAR